jgi:hypothetical protein
VGRHARRQFDLSGSATGWGLNLTQPQGRQEGRHSRAFVVGEGIQNSMNDSPVDIGIENNPGTRHADRGQAAADDVVSLFVDHTWNAKFSTPSATRRRTSTTPMDRRPRVQDGQYALGNLLYYPVPNAMVGGELQWGRRENFSDGSARRLQAAVLVQVQLLGKLGG